MKKKNKIKLKEIRIRPRIGDHDLKVKLKQASKFLEKGHQVRVTVMYRTVREKAVSKTIGKEKLAQFLELGKPMSPAKWSGSGRNYSVILC